MLGGWTNMLKEELHNTDAPSNITRIIKSRTTIWAEHVERMREKRYAYKI
jgi:hypothetical protein